MTDSQVPPAKTVAVIDMGSNSVRLVIAQVHADGRTEVLERARQPIRLGHDAFTTGRLGQGTMRAALAVLRDYRRIINTYKCDLVRAVATSAVREASNRDPFLDRLEHTVDLTFDVIEPAEQSRLLVSAVRHELGDVLAGKRHTSLVAEVGGGSTLLSVMHGSEIAASESYYLGSVRMQEMLSTEGATPVRAADVVRQVIANTIEQARKSLRLREVRAFIAVGGDARFAGQQAGEPLGRAEAVAVDAKKLDALIQKCVPHAPEDLASTYGLPFEDAETLVPGLLVYQGLLKATRAERMIISQVSMRDGLLIDLPRVLSGKEDPDLAEGIVASAKAVGAKYFYDAKHGEHVARLALRLFDETEKEHGLTQRHRLLLHVASLLHEIGKFVGNRSHHKHSWYLIVNAEIMGLRREDLAIVAAVSRYHRRSAPKSTHPEYMQLAREDRMVVSKLAAILRVADAVDRGHWQQVCNFRVERREQDFVMFVKGSGDMTLERRALQDKADLFEDIFGMRVRIEEEAASTPGGAKTTG